MKTEVEKMVDKFGISVMAEYMDEGYYNSVIFNIKFTPEQLAEIKRITGEQENTTNG